MAACGPNGALLSPATTSPEVNDGSIFAQPSNIDLSGMPTKVQLAGVFSNHMVLQRETPIRIWGRAPAGDTLQVGFRGERKTVIADRNGNWQTLLRPAPAGGPHELMVKGSNTLHLHDILVGEVWVCAGQSNMEFTVGQALNAENEIAAADHPQIRHLKIAHRASLQPMDDIEPTGWKVSSPATVSEFSAVAYFFARKLQQQLHVPIGLVNVSWGGTHAETWISREALARDPDFAPIMASLPNTQQAWLTQRTAKTQALVTAWQPKINADKEDPSLWSAPEYTDAYWRKLSVPQYWEEQGLENFDGYVWYRHELELNASQIATIAETPAILHLGAIDDCDKTWVNGQHIGTTCGWDKLRSYTLPIDNLHVGRNIIAVRVTDTGGGGGFHGDAALVKLQLGSTTLPLAGLWQSRIEAALNKPLPDANDLPTLAFNGMVRPLTPMRIRGVIWYQGESNVTRASQYVETFKHLITDWRSQWRQGDVPFHFVQLASFLPLERNSLEGSNWAELRDAQRQALMLPHTGMAVATDIGDANDIHPKNKQTVGLRLALLALGHNYGQAVTTNGPVFETMTVKGDQAILSFRQAQGGLVAHGSNGALHGFAIAGDDRRFVQAQAHIEGTHVVVSSPEVPLPHAVRFGWVNNPEQNNLFNSEGLPAGPFRTDRWPLTTEGHKFQSP